MPDIRDESTLLQYSLGLEDISINSMVWFWSLLLGIIVAACVMTDVWLYLLQGLAGLSYMFLTLVNPLVGLFLWVLIGPTAGPYVEITLPGPDISFERVAVTMVVVTLMLQVIINKRRLLQITPTEKAMLVFCGVLLGDLYIRSSSLASEGLIVFDTYGTPFLLFFAVKNLMALPKDGTRFFAILFCLGVYLAIWGIYQYATFSGKDPSLAQVDVGVIAGVEQERDVAGAISLGRAVGPFDDSVQFGAVVGICFIWTFFLALYKTRGMIRVWLALALLVMGVAIVISLQRSVWLGFFIAFVAIAVMQRRLRRMIVTAFLVVSVISLGTTLVLLDYSRVEERLVDEYSIKQRIIMYQAALSMAVESPVAGYGKGKRAFVRGRLDHVSSVGSIGAEFGLEAGPPHNIFLFTLLQWGLLGLVPYLAILYFLIACSLEIRRLRPNRQSFPHCLAVFFLATTALYVTQGMLMDVAELTFLTSLYFILGGFLEGTRQRIKAEQSLAQATAG